MFRREVLRSITSYYIVRQLRWIHCPTRSNNVCHYADDLFEVKYRGQVEVEGVMVVEVGVITTKEVVVGVVEVMVVEVVGDVVGVVVIEGVVQIQGLAIEGVRGWGWVKVVMEVAQL